MGATGSKTSEEAVLAATIERAREGDAEAFAELYRLFSRRVFGLCRHLLDSREAAEDACSEVFLRAQRAMKSYNRALPFSRWILSIASHYCVDQLRRRRVERRLFTPEDLDAPEPRGPAVSPLKHALVREQRDTVRQAVSKLPERYRLPLVLRYYSEMSYEQIAGALGLNRNHVATLIFRAKKDLRRSLSRLAEERSS